MNVCIVCGARPNFIKVAPVIRALESAKERGETVDYHLVFSGDETDPTLERSLFDDLGIRRPDVYLGVTCENLNELTGRVMAAFERYLQKHATDTVVVVDDLASTLAVAIVAKKQGVRLAHIAAGTRSFDIAMPKEINRLVIDGLSDILFTAGMSNNSIANREGAELSKVYMVGNVLMDNMRYIRNSLQKPAIFDELALADRGYLLFTLNRKALIGHRDNLGKMLDTIVRERGGMPVVAPLRRLAKQAVIDVLGDKAERDFIFVEPLAYLDFSYLAAHAAGVITDSGNVAEEATFNQVPCITLNSYTEHVETVKVGTNELVDEDPSKLGMLLAKMVAGTWKESALPERWDGRSAERIVKILLDS